MLTSMNAVIRRCSSNSIFNGCVSCISKVLRNPYQLESNYGVMCITRNCSAWHKSENLRNPVVSEYNPASSTYFEEEAVPRKTPLQLNIIQNALLKMRSPSENEINDFRNKVVSSGNVITESNIDAVVMGCCAATKNLNFANAYLEFMEQKDEVVNVATLSKYMKLCYACGGVDDESKILQIYDSLQKRLPLMDASTAENVIRGLSVTSEWRKGLELINVVKETCSPGTTTYSALIIAAFRNEDVELGWNLMEECVKEDKVPMDTVFLAWLELFCTEKKGSTSDDQLKNAEHLLNFLSSHELKASIMVARKIKAVFESMNWRGNLTSIDDRCRCESCKAAMPPVIISKSEFKTLSKTFLEKVLVGPDVFSKSTPEEVEAFQTFIANNAPYNTVIDGLNVAYSAGTEGKGNHSSAVLLQSVVEYFVDLSHKILVLGRNHMNSWPKREMDYIRSNSHLFLTENLSQDDPFLLYAAMSSGTGTCFLSRDLMRSHTHRLKCAEPGLVSMFRRWQLSHQMRFIGFSRSQRVIIKYPLEYSPTVQKVDGNWHIPCQDDHDQDSTGMGEKKVPVVTRSFLDSPSTWLCISPKKPGEKLHKEGQYGGKNRNYRNY